jgi:hypothetical protein
MSFQTPVFAPVSVKYADWSSLGLQKGPDPAPALAHPVLE